MLTLEPFKTYRCRNGQIITVVRELNSRPSEFFQFQDSSGYSRSSCGRISPDRESPLDVIAEYSTAGSFAS